MTLQFQPSEPDHVPAELIVDFDMFHVPKGITDPTQIWHDLVKRGVPKIFYTPRNGGHWVFLNYDDIAEGYRNHEIFSTHQTPIPPIEPFPTMQPQGIDPPEHKVFRSLLAPLFTPTAVRKLMPELHKRSVELIEPLIAKGRCDFITEYAERFPTAVFLHIMGLPEERLPDFLRMANTFFRSADDAERAANVQEIYAELEILFRHKERNPADDIATVIVNARDKDGEQHNWQDILDCGFLLFVAGLDTVTNTMASVWRFLATNPSARQFFLERMDDQEALMPAVEELLRITSVANNPRRIAKDCEFRGVKFRKNDRLLLVATLANRDPKVFPNPQEIDLDREVNNHVTFGVGPHRCIGSILAKREIMVSLQEWMKRIPDFWLADPQPPSTLYGGTVMGFKSLVVEWSKD